MTAVVRRSPSIIDELDRMVGEVWGPGVLLGPLFGGMDVYEEENELVLKADMPGVKKDDIDISLKNDVLYIRAERKGEEEHRGAKRYAHERRFGTYSRSVQLPFCSDAEKVSATFENGVLEIRLPKPEEAKTKHIEVKVQ
jgi:HSP20 family protein